MTRDASIPLEIDIDAVVAQLRDGGRPTFIDVREPDEHADGVVQGALLVPLGSVAERIGTLIPDRDARIVVYCARGGRSLTAARQIQALGYRSVESLRGGFAEWQQRGLAWAVPPQDDAMSVLDSKARQRYARHLRLPEVGSAGQRKLLDARVLCIGAGGLGSPASLYLAAAGIGTLGLVDDDRVEVSNLQRQILHTTARVGVPKVSSAAATLSALNPDTKVIAHETRLTAANALEILAPYDVIVDGSDNFATRYLVNDAALRLAKPVVHGAVLRFEGQISVFRGVPCYRCLFPQPPKAGESPSCAEAGVLGVLPGVIGSLQATETIKLILGIGESLVGRLLVYDALSMRFEELRVSADPRCSVCGAGVDRSRIALTDGLLPSC